jgi:hypothetical protein
LNTVKIVAMPGPVGPRGEPGEFSGAYGYFYSNENQENLQDINIVTLSDTKLSRSVSIDSQEKIVISESGVYSIQFSIQAEKSDSGQDFIEVWLRKNGIDDEQSSTQVKLSGGNAKQLLSWNFFVTVESPGDYFELAWYSPDEDLSLGARAIASNPVRPAIPSVILSVNKVGTL